MTTELLTGKEIAKLVSKVANSMSTGDERLMELANELTRDHRTLQQGIMRNLVMPMLRQWASDFEEGHYDDRNEATVKAAAAAVKAIDANVGRGGMVAYFPFI